jgi:murein DD-endopeptidase MepM/ murein hydrolase activator NlpD
MPDRRGWSASPVTRIGRRAVILLLALSTFGGLFTASVPPNAYADELSDAYDKQQALEKLIAKQRASIRSLTASQVNLSARISSTKRSLSQLNANLLTVKTQIVGMVVDVARGQSAVDELNATAGRLDAELASIEAEAAAKEQDLQERMALLAARIVEAYDTDRTSILETFLSGGDFTDVLTEVGYHLEFAEQDKLLADQIAEDRKVLDVLKENVELARAQTAELRDLAASSKKALDRQLAELAAARKELAKLEAETERLLAAQQAAYAKLAANKAKAAATLKAAQEADRKLEALIARLVREALAKGGIPSVYNGTFQWPMQGRITQEYGCTGFSWEPAYGNCRHFHNGIDIANTMYTRVYAAGAGKVIWAGKSPYSTSWNVIIAHSEHLVTWYAHLDNRAHPPVVRVGQYVAKGQLIAFEGMTGYTTGPHLHWAAQLDGNWVNPRLFLPR